MAAFWIAYILTRPLGASVADWLGKGKPLGEGFGDGIVTVAALVFVLAFAGYLARNRSGFQPVVAA